jgi:hypothetical protein
MKATQTAESTSTRSATDVFSTAVTHSFAHPAQAPRSPLQPRQPSASNVVSELGKSSRTATDVRPSESAGVLRQSRNIPNQPIEEPELPPTPTQLGLSPKPDRPRGLAASSSPGSRGPRRSRLRSSQTATSSPLKPRDKMHSKKAAEASMEEEEVQLAEEAPESDVEEAETALSPHPANGEPANKEDGSEDIASRRRQRNDLKAQLAQLQAETQRLEGALSAAIDADEEVDENILTLLSAPNPSCDPNFVEPTPTSPSMILKDPVALDINPLAFLRAFAPGDLRLSTTTKSTKIRGRLHQAHVLNVSAPRPWPPHVFTATFRVTCDVESRRVVSITGVDLRPRRGAGVKELRQWIDNRLKNPLHKLDAGSIVWGLGMWWKESVRRAQFFRHVDLTKAGKAKQAQIAAFHYEPVRADDVQCLILYIGKAFVELIPAEAYFRYASTNEQRKTRQTQLLLKWEVELDWSGEAETTIDVAGTKISAKGQEEVKQVFRELMRRKGLDIAVREVVELCCAGSKKRN